MLSSILLLALAGSFTAGLAIIEGTDGDDRLRGSAEDDGISGGDGDDKIGGNDGNDVLIGGAGDDKVFGSLGDDILGGGDGEDRLFGGRGDDEIAGGADADFISASRGDDIVFGERGADLIEAGRGNDVIDGGRGNDEIYGDRGADSIDGGSGNDDLYGGKGNDTIEGGLGANLIHGGAGDDLLIGGDQASDIFVALQGDNTIDSNGDGYNNYDGTGNMFVVSTDNMTTIEYFVPRGSIGLDTLVIDHDPANGPPPEITFTDLGDGLTQVLADGKIFAELEMWDSNPITMDDVVFRDVTNGGLDYQFLRTGEASSDFVDAPRDPQADSDLDQSIVGRTGADELNGGDGNDSIFGDRGADTINGGAGDDYIDGGKAAGFLDNQRLFGGAGNDVVIGGGNDVMSGGSGDDLLVAQNNGDPTGEGQDQYLFGGSGADIFVVEDPSDGSRFIESRVRIQDFDGNEDRLVIEHSGDYNELEVQVYSDRVDVVIDRQTAATVRGVNMENLLRDLIIVDLENTDYDYAAIAALGR